MTKERISAERSATMRAVKSRDTRPELRVRSLAHALGFRFSLHRADLPGKPDLVFSGRSKIVFVNGCFWHGHTCKRGIRKPKSNSTYWQKKISRNKERDAKQRKELKKLGWQVLTIWECQLKEEKPLKSRLSGFLKGNSGMKNIRRSPN